ncbi:MAG: ABC transporter ATP-binding protein [Rhodoferax sp.]|nr:ABC transporter ATP-binding protein [Rhodoferax sp.]
MGEPILSVRGLTTTFRTETGVFAAVDDVSFDVAPGEVLGIVGESGSGKSVTALSILGLLPDPPGRIASGSIRFDGREIVGLPKKALRSLRGPSIGMIFQEPMTSLNPVFRIGDQITETIRAHESISKADARKRAIGLLDRVGIAMAGQRLDDYPHQLSGGMRQRVMIAIALACSPRLLLADEPTTALDVTIQAQLLDLLRDIQRDTGMAVVIITHNMGVIAEFADRVLVMYAGRVAEQGTVDAVFSTPRHPYTVGLLGSTPSLEREEARLTTIPGVLPQLSQILPGCRFAPRCGRRTDACTAAKPPLVEFGGGQRVACFHGDVAGPGSLP